MKPDELVALGKDMKLRGQRHPILACFDPDLGEKAVIIPYSRYCVALMERLDPWIVETEDDPLGLIESEDLRRRDLPVVVKKSIAEWMIKLRREAGLPDLTDHELGRRIGISQPTAGAIQRELTPMKTVFIAKEIRSRQRSFPRSRDARIAKRGWRSPNRFLRAGM